MDLPHLERATLVYVSGTCPLTLLPFATYSNEAT
jgi:hypothetical protein